MRSIVFAGVWCLLACSGQFVGLQAAEHQSVQSDAATGLLQLTELRVGRAAVDISPEPGTPMLTPQRPPYAIKLATTPHDPLWVKAVVFEVGSTRAAVVACDLTSIPAALIDKMREAAAKATSLQPEAIMISATHSHTVPQIRPQFLMNADEVAREKAAAYVAALPDKVAAAVRQAESDLQPVVATAALGREETVSFNRRFFMNDGRLESNPFKDNPDELHQVLRAAGPVDPQLGVITFEYPETQQPRAVLLNYAIHLDTIGGDQPSADFPYMIDQIISAVYGPEVLAFFGNGASGNINHYDLLHPERVRRSKSPQEAARIGTLLAAAAIETHPVREVLQTTSLKVAKTNVRLQYRADKAAALLKKLDEGQRVIDSEVEVFKQDGEIHFEVEVQAIALGNELVWVSFPGEMFVEFGLQLKAASPFKYTMIHTLANGSIGYIPNRRAYFEGGREAISTRCAPGSGEKLVDAASQLIAELKRQNP